MKKILTAICSLSVLVFSADCLAQTITCGSKKYPKTVTAPDSWEAKGGAACTIVNKNTHEIFSIMFVDNLFDSTAKQWAEESIKQVDPSNVVSYKDEGDNQLVFTNDGTMYSIVRYVKEKKHMAVMTAGGPSNVDQTEAEAIVRSVAPAPEAPAE